MYFRMNWGRIKPGKWVEFEAAFKKVAPRSRQAEGMRGRWLVRSTDEPDFCYSLSMWDSEEAMTAYHSNTEIHKEILAALEPFFAEDFRVSQGEVCFSEE